MLLQDLYQEMIIDHGKAPRNSGVLSHATHQKIGHNPLCGDKLILYLIVNNQIVVDARFEGSGCAISIASASLMTEIIKGKTLVEIAMLFHAFHLLVTEGKKPNQDLGKLMVFSGVYHFPIRVKCATLAWHTFRVALEENPLEEKKQEVFDAS